MKTKKLVSLLVAIGLIAAVGIGSTLAYFTSQDSNENIFTLGNVGITLEETTEEEGNNEVMEDGIAFFDVLPGQEISKMPLVNVNSDSQECYIRVKMDLVWDGEVEGDEVAAITDENMQDLKDGLTVGDGWSYNEIDGYYYYGMALNAGESTTPLFDMVMIPSNWGNATAGQTMNMNLQAEAVQSNYSEDVINMTGENVTGWTLTQVEMDDLGITTP